MVEKVGIILPFFRSGAYIREAIESVLAQEDSPAWRLYFIDDGSDEEDTEVAATFCRLYPSQMQLLQHPGRIRKGISASRNLGIRACKADLIAFIDADDTWYPHKLASQVSLLDAHPGAAMVYGSALRWHSWCGGEDFHVPAEIDGFGTDCLVSGAALLQTFLRDEGLTPCTGSVLIRRAALNGCGAFENQFWGLFDDQVLYAKLCLSSDIYASSDCVSRYRRHSESCCSQAAANGTTELERVRFLSWLSDYRPLLCAR